MTCFITEQHPSLCRSLVRLESLLELSKLSFKMKWPCVPFHIKSLYRLVEAAVYGGILTRKNKLQVLTDLAATPTLCGVTASTSRFLFGMFLLSYASCLSICILFQLLSHLTKYFFKAWTSLSLETVSVWLVRRIIFAVCGEPGVPKRIIWFQKAAVFEVMEMEACGKF